MTPDGGVDLILHRLHLQDQRLEQIYAEVRATNGRVTALEARALRDDGGHAAEDAAQAAAHERHDFWRDRLVSFFLGSFSALLVAVAIELLK